MENYAGEQGRLHIGSDGSLALEVEDDFYSGTIAAKDALELARHIIAKHEKD